MKRIIPIMLLLVLVACNTTKETRRAARAEKALKRLTIKFPELLQRDSLIVPFETIVEREVIDTILLKSDTVYLEKENMKVQVITYHDSIFIQAECKERIIRDTIRTVVDKIEPWRRMDGTEISREKVPFNWTPLIFVLVLVLLIAIILKRWMEGKN